MAGKISQGARAPQYHPGKPNKVLRVAEVKTLAVAFTNSEGRESMCLVHTFGKDVEDGGAGVYVLAEEQQMAEQLKIANTTVKTGVRAWLAGQKDVAASNIPAAVLQVAGPVTDGKSFDVAGVEIGAETPEE
jgi:hypothetical protein